MRHSVENVDELNRPSVVDSRQCYFDGCSKKREVVPDLAPMLWHSFGTIAALLQEIISIYPAINPPNLTVSKQLWLIMSVLAVPGALCRPRDVRIGLIHFLAA